MEPLLQRFTEAGQVQGSAPQIAVMEGQLTWLVHIIGAIIRGRMSSSRYTDLDCTFSDGVFPTFLPLSVGCQCSQCTLEWVTWEEVAPDTMVKKI